MGQVKEKKILTPHQRQKRQEKHHRDRMRRRAAILSICQLTDSTYRVWGGKDEHILTVLPAQGIVVCDCQGWNTARNHQCSHVWKWILTHGDLKKVSK